MTNLIAVYYINELDDWKKTIDLQLKEIEESKEWLNEILQFNTVLKLAAKVEHYLNTLLLLQQNLLYIKYNIQTLELKLYKEERPVENEMVTEDLKKHQNELRSKMHRTEKEYLDIKYSCDEFLAETVIEQNKKKKNDNQH